MIKRKQRLGYLLILILLLLSPFVFAPLLNNNSSKELSNSLLALALPQGSEIVNSSAYISSNHGACFYFAGALLSTGLSTTDLEQFYHKNTQADTFPYDINIVWMEADSAVISLPDLNRVKHAIPVNAPYFGGNVGDGINELMNLARREPALENGQYIIIFTIEQHDNFFDFRCY